MTKIVFLDIDGVLNSFDPESVDFGFDKDKVRRLRTIIRETGAYIVITSDWKYSPLDLYDNRYLQHDLPPILSITNQSDLFGKNGNFEKTREEEIKLWLKNTEVRTRDLKYVVIDDMPLNIDNFFKTSIHKGLTDDIMNNIIAFLKK